MGFSPVGLIVALVMLAPSLALWAWPPRTPLPGGRVPWPLAWLETAGQALCVATAVFVVPGEMVATWAIPTVVTIVAYHALWARFLFGGRAAATLYAAWWVVPIPMAIVPVLAFLGAAFSLSNPWLAVSAVILAAGHVPASALRVRAGGGRPWPDRMSI